MLRDLRASICRVTWTHSPLALTPPQQYWRGFTAVASALGVVRRGAADGAGGADGARVAPVAGVAVADGGALGSPLGT